MFIKTKKNTFQIIVQGFQLVFSEKRASKNNILEKQKP